MQRDMIYPLSRNNMLYYIEGYIFTYYFKI